MNRKNFLKTGIIGAVIGFFTSKLIAKQEDNEFKLINKIDKNKILSLSTHLTIAHYTTSEEIEKLFLKINPSGFILDGNFESIMYRLHRNLLAVLAKSIADSDENKHLNIDYPDLLKEFVEKYQITNLSK